MTLRFSLPFRTSWGQQLVVCGSGAGLGHWAPDQALVLHYHPDSGSWIGELEVADEQPATLHYKYVLRNEQDGSTQWEWGPNRTVAPDGRQFSRLVLEDYWRAPAEPENELFTAAFTQALFRRPRPAARTAPAARLADSVVRFQLTAPRVEAAHQVCVLGSDAALGAWDARKAVVLSDAAYPTWTADVALEQPDQPVRYKYGIRDPQNKQLVLLEAGEDRVRRSGAGASTRSSPASSSTSCLFCGSRMPYL